MHEAVCDFSVLRELRKNNSLSIEALAKQSGISASVISKLERNRSTAEMDTLYRIAKVFGLTLSDLISLAEKRTSQRVSAQRDTSGDFEVDRIQYNNVRCMHAVVPKGDLVSRPEIHQDDYEICWVVHGNMRITLPGETADLSGGMSIQFDALLPHSYKALDTSEIFIVHVKKGKRF